MVERTKITKTRKSKTPIDSLKSAESQEIYRHSDIKKEIEELKASMENISSRINQRNNKDQEPNWARKGVWWTRFYTILTIFIVLVGVYQGYLIRQTLLDSQRPWVSAEAIHSIKQYRSQAGDDRFSILAEVVIKNYGTSVANEGWVHMRALTNAAVDLSEGWNQACRDVRVSQAGTETTRAAGLGDEWPIGFSLPPNGETTLKLGTEEPKISPEGVRDGYFYLIGCMYYRDQYKIEHHTNFCFVPRGVRDSVDTINPQYKSASDIEFVQCNAFQEAD